MKVVVGWLCDPFLHIVLLAAVLVYCGMGNVAEEAIVEASAPLPGCHALVAAPRPTAQPLSVVAKVEPVLRPE